MVDALISKARMILPVSQVTMVIYHGSGCKDGFAAATVVHTIRQDMARYIAANHGDAPPNVTGHNVLIVDFSYKREVLEQLRLQANKILVLDHHKTAEQDLRDLDYAVFDMDRSGARLAWDYAYGLSGVPGPINYIQDRDLWTWKLPNSREFSAGLDQLPQTFEAYTELFEQDSVFMDCIKVGKVLIQNENRVIDRTLQSASYLPLRVGCIAHVNTNYLMSEVGAKLALQDVQFSLVYFYQGDKKCFLCSLRSKRGGADVSVIAKKLGGGGNVNASGFNYNSDDIAELFTSVVNAAQE